MLFYVAAHLILSDGWILNVTQESFGLASNPDVFNSSSARFKEVQQIICDAVSLLTHF